MSKQCLRLSIRKFWTKRTECKNYFLLIALVFFIISCSNYDEESVSKGDSIAQKQILLPNSKEECKVRFAEILSRVVYENQGVRELLRKEAIKQFDMNDDVLFYLVKDEKVGNESLRDILVASSSEEEISNIEKNVPLLNILIPTIPFFNISAQTMDVNDQEIPVAVVTGKGTDLYVNGEKEGFVEKGEVPDFTVLVINENTRVEIKDGVDTRSTGNKWNNIVFRSPNFNKSLVTRAGLVVKLKSTLYKKAIHAYNVGFNKDDGSDSQKAYQRDYIYYGITPTQRSGSLNKSINEYIDYIEVNPNAYFKISDYDRKAETTEDPIIKKTKVEQTKRPLTFEEQIERMWTLGAYSFRFDVIKSNGSVANCDIISVRPEELWDFHISVDYQHRSFWRHSKYTYHIDPRKFTSKRYFLSTPIALGKWNIAEEATNRWIKIIEEDAGTKTTITEKYSFTKVQSNKITTDFKAVVGFGTNDKNSMSGDVGYEHSTTKTTNNSTEVTYERYDKDDELGKIEVHFYDPIIESKSLNQYTVKEYSVGTVSFSITAR